MGWQVGQGKQQARRACGGPASSPAGGGGGSSAASCKPSPAAPAPVPCQTAQLAGVRMHVGRLRQGQHQPAPAPASGSPHAWLIPPPAAARSAISGRAGARDPGGTTTPHSSLAPPTIEGSPLPARGCTPRQPHLPPRRRSRGAQHTAAMRALRVALLFAAVAAAMGAPSELGGAAAGGRRCPRMAAAPACLQPVALPPHDTPAGQDCCRALPAFWEPSQPLAAPACVQSRPPPRRQAA